MLNPTDYAKHVRERITPTVTPQDVIKGDLLAMGFKPTDSDLQPTIADYLAEYHQSVDVLDRFEKLITLPD